MGIANRNGFVGSNPTLLTITIKQEVVEWLNTAINNINVSDFKYGVVAQLVETHHT